MSELRGVTPPNNVEAEQSVLGAMLQDSGAVLQDLTLKDVCEVHTAPSGFGEGYFNEFGEWVSGYFNEFGEWIENLPQMGGEELPGTGDENPGEHAGDFLDWLMHPTHNTN